MQFGIRFFLVVSFIMVLGGCGLQPSTILPNKVGSLNIVNSGTITSIPIKQISATSLSATYITLTNTSNLDLQLAGFYQQAIKTNMANHLIQFNDSTNKCINLKANSNCQLMVTVPDIPNSYLVKIKFVDKDNVSYFVTQIINVEDDLPSVNGFIYSTANSQLNIRNSSISLPVLLDNDYTDIQLKTSLGNAKLLCNHTKYEKDTLCTVLINLTKEQLSDNREINLQLLGKHFSEKTFHTKVRFSVLASTTAANIITSAINPTLNPATTSQQIFLYNSGSAVATNLSIINQQPLLIESNDCPSSLNNGTNCSFYVKSNVSANGQSAVYVNYNTNNSTQVLSFNVSYLNQSVSPSLSLTSNGGFSNVFVNNGPVFLSITVKNTGGVVLNNLQLSNIESQNSAMSYVNSYANSCTTGQSLSVNQSCIIVIQYSPAAAQAAGTVRVIPVMQYSDQGGAVVNYSQSSLSIPYSAVTTALLIAGGDYGQVINSSNATTWNVSINNPFPTSTTVASGLAYNSSANTYALVFTGSGLVKYSTLNGLFWQTGTIPVGATNTDGGIISDASRFYIAGTGGANRAIKYILASNLTGTWTTAFTPATDVIRLYYFNNGVNSAYIANLNTDIAASNNGVSWAFIDFTGTNRTYVPAVLGSSNILYTFANQGNQRASITNFLTPADWQSSSIISGGTVTGAAYDGTNYFLTTSQGEVYATSNPGAVAYATRYNSGNVLNDVTFGNGVRIAIGNSGVNVRALTTTESWAANIAITIGQSTNPNLTRAYFLNNKFWAVGTSTIVNSINGASLSWSPPSLNSVTYNSSDNSYLSVDNQGNIYRGESNLTTWTQQTNPTGRILNFIKCIGGRCYAVGESGTILSTTNNGTNWNIVNSGVNNNLKSLACGVQQCVIVGESGIVLVADTNLTSFQSASSGVTTTLNSVISNGIQFIAVGDSGVIRVSNNGTNWSAKTSGTANRLNSIAYNGNFGCVAVGAVGTVLTSAGNCNSWIIRTSNTTNDLQAVSYLGTTLESGIFAAVGKSSTIVTASITNIDTWTVRASGLSSTANNLTTIITQTPG